MCTTEKKILGTVKSYLKPHNQTEQNVFEGNHLKIHFLTENKSIPIFKKSIHSLTKP